MTARERVTMLFDEYGCEKPGEETIIGIVEAAIAEEREACASLAESHKVYCDAWPTCSNCGRDGELYGTKYDIASAIRRRGVA